MQVRQTLITLFVIALASLLHHVPAAAAQDAKAADAPAGEKLDVLIIDGQNNHNWKATTPLLRAMLEGSGRFAVEVVTTPAGGLGDGSGWEKFDPDFAKYDVVMLTRGAEWAATGKVTLPKPDDFPPADKVVQRELAASPAASGK